MQLDRLTDECCMDPRQLLCLLLCSWDWAALYLNLYLYLSTSISTTLQEDGTCGT